MSSSTCNQFEGENERICVDAIEYVKSHKSEFITAFADISKYPPEDTPITVFMAGSPGAGKTEFSKRLIQDLIKSGQTEITPVRIDSDDIREMIPGYTGNNSEVFQAASAIIVEKLYDRVLKMGQSVIMDGTFSSEKSLLNVERSIHRKRVVHIFYIYQDPKIAWDFTQKREKLEGRNIPKSAFIDSFFTARENVNKIKKKFPNQVTLNLVIKNFENGFEELRLNIDTVDHYLDLEYTKDDIEKLIS